MADSDRWIEMTGPLYTVARTFRWTALAGICFSTAVFCQGIFNLRVTPAGDPSITSWYVLLGISVAFAVLFFLLLVTAKHLAIGHPRGHAHARLACRLMYLGFPLLTLLGWLCQRKLREHLQVEEAANG